MLTFPSPQRSAKLGEDSPSADKASITSECVCILLFLNGWWGATFPSLTSHRNAAAFTRRAFALLK